MSLSNSNSLLAELGAFNSGTVTQDPEAFAKLLQVFVQQGSQLHTLRTEDITVYYNPVGNVDGLETETVTGEGEKIIAQNVKGLMAAGAKFFDAIIYLSLAEEDRPVPSRHNNDKKGKDTRIPVYNEPGRITQYVFAVFFFIMIRAHAPTGSGDYKAQPMPKFISGVLGISGTAGEMSEYLASFPLVNLDPSWVKHIEMKGLGQEAASRFGLGVAGYRLVSVFNVAAQDKYRTVKAGQPIPKGEEKRLPLEEKPAWLDEAIEVAKSFRSAGPCWDFHPATRHPDVLSRYGNINKNASNLILDTYNEETIASLVKSKKLAISPSFDINYTEFRQWKASMLYTATSKIFPK